MQLRRLAHINPPAPAFEVLPTAAAVTFQPLETVWANARVDRSRQRPKADVANGFVRFQEGDILLPKTAPTFEHGRAMIARGLVNGAGAGSTELHVLRARGGVDSRFLGYVVRSSPFIEQGVSAYQGVAGLQRVPAEFVAAWPVAELPLEEQRRIADFLDDQVALLDRAIALRQQQALLVNTSETTVLAEMIDAALKRAEQPLKRLTAGIEQGSSPQCDNVAAEGDEWGVLKLSAVKRGRFRPDENKRLPTEQPPASQYRVHEGDLLVTRANAPLLVGDVAVARGVRSKLQLSDLLYRVQLQPGVHPEFVAAALLSPRVRGLISSLARGTSQSMVKLRGEDILSLPLPQASAAGQRLVADQFRASLARADDAQQVLGRSIVLLQERKQALIAAAVTGALDVTTARSAA